MLTRVAIFEGALAPGQEDNFFADVKERLEPIWRSFPHVEDVRVLRALDSDPGSIPIVMVLEMDFPDMEAIRAALASDVRTKARAATLDVLKPFTGRFFHVICESRSLGTLGGRGSGTA